MRNIFYILAILPFFIFAQELDDEYLESLPESVRKDVLEKIEAQKNSEEPIYRRASTKIDKEKDDEDERGEILLPVFGNKFFDTIQSSFMPINEPNLGSSYILDFGDVLEIQIIGQIDSIDSYPISRDGSINVPDLGKVNVAGLSLKDASDIIKQRIKDLYIGTEGFITLTNVRDITIVVAGNSYNPGIYTLNGNTNMLHAISMAGGIGENGSYRNISLVRNGETIDTLDLYSVFLFGKHNLQKGLRSGDSIVIHPANKIITIESGVLRPARYELNDNESIEDLVSYANGYNRYADRNSILIKRLDQGTTQTISLGMDDAKTFNLNDGDSVFIQEFKVNTVKIEGAVKNPGIYNVKKGTTLSQLIDNAGGYDEFAYPFGGFLENQSALEINTAAKEKLYDVFLENIIVNSGSMMGENGLGGIGQLLENIKNSKVSGRVIAEFDLDIIKNNPNLDTTLEHQDRVIIPNMTQQVYIQGEISNPGAIRYSPMKDIEYYIENSGGTLDGADLSNIFIIHPNGETTNLKSRSNLSFIIAENKTDLIYPGSIIYVPRSTNFRSPIEVASIWAPILSSVALSLTSLSVLNNNN